VSSLKPLKSVAHNLCGQFGSTLNYWGDDYGINHLAHAARAAGGRVSIDLLAGTSTPALGGLGPELVRQLSATLSALLQKESFAPDLLLAGTAIYDFQTPRPDPLGSSAYDCTVRFDVKGGRVYVIELSERNLA